jgi:putative ABC transport system permease protein
MSTREAKRGTPWRAMARVGLHMMFHDKLKMLATLAGVVFAVVLANQGAGVFLGLLDKNTFFVDKSGADLCIVPLATQTCQDGKSLPDAVLMSARTTPGVAWADPIIVGTAQVNLPNGGSEPVTVVGSKYPQYRGGPINMVVGTPDVLGQPDTMIFEDYEREKLGDLNLGDVREVNGHKVTAGGFTWGLIPFGPSFAFADWDLARTLFHQDADRVSYVLVGLEPGADVEAAQAALQAKVPDATVLTTKQFSRSIMRYVLVSTSIGITIGTTTGVAIIVGFFIVGLSMFSAVVDNIREFGTLKAIGAKNVHLAILLFTQAVVFGLAGSLLGLFVITRMAGGIRSPTMTLILPGELFAGTTVFMTILCILASSLSLLRLRKVEPAMVFQ